jgi:hypothetical protein
MHLVGANASAPGAAEDALPGKSNYFIGNDRTKWRTDVPNYGRVRYRGVYPGIDLVYYGNQRLLEHDFVVAPGADPRRIRLAFDGIKRAAVEKSGDLVLQLADGEVRLQKPVIYQNTEAGRREVTGGFVLRNNQVTIQVGSYDRRRALVIDPVLSYSTYLGGNGEDFGSAVAVDGSGNIYIVGYSASTTGFPTTTGAFSQTCGGASVTCNTSSGSDDAFVIMLNSAFVQLYGTFIGGNDDDEAYSIAVDSAGNAYITGFTNSSDFAGTTPGALKSFMGNAFVTEINPQGNSLVFSTLIGGSAREFGLGIALDSLPTPNIYLNGYSWSTDFPVVGTPITTPPAVMYHSTNGGTGWSAGAGVTSLDVKAIVADKSNPGTVYAGAIGGLYKSAHADQRRP